MCSAQGLKGEQRKLMKAALGDLRYVCGSPLVPEDHALHGVLYTRGGLDCRAPMETQYFTTSLSGRNTAVCGICGLAEQPPADVNYSFVQPTCAKCRAAGEQCRGGVCGTQPPPARRRTSRQRGQRKLRGAGGG